MITFVTLDIVIRCHAKTAGNDQRTDKGRRTAGTAGRGARRRLETRARLVRAARELMARKGVGATSIQEITEAADVGFGSIARRSLPAIAAPQDAPTGERDPAGGRRRVRSAP